jgi:putative ABC transport system permease protein
LPQWRRFRRFFGLEPKADVEAELVFHLDMRIRELVGQGETPERARELALQRFGDYDGTRRACVAIDERRRRRMERAEFMTDLRQDVAYALRMLRRTPGFTAVALLTLALGIGANSAIFSVVHGVLLESLPFRDAERLFQVRMLYPDGTKYSSVSAPDFMNVREENRVFEQVEAYDVRLLTMLGAGEPREISGATVTSGLFDLLGMPISLGRAFRPEENEPGRGGVAILDHGFWQRVFGSDRNVLGRSMTIAGSSYTIVGVLASGAGLPDDADVFVPLPYDATFSAASATGRRSEFLSVLGRARTGVRIDEIENDLRRIGARLQTAFPRSNESLTFTTTPLGEMIVGDVRRPLFMLLGAVGLVLLVACSNVANLLLARGSARHGELAVRAALGAGRARLLRQLVTEAVVLGLTGAGLGLLLAYWGTEALIAARPADIPRLDEVGLDTTVVFFTLGVAVVTSIAFGMLPALQATTGRLTSGLQEGGRAGSAGRNTHRVRAALVVGEMALAVVLLTGSGLLIRSFLQLTRVHPGFEPRGAVAVRLSFQGDLYQRPEQIRARVVELEDRLRVLPGVTAVASATVLPLGGSGPMLDFAVEGAPPPPPDVNQEIAVVSVTPDYVRAIGAPLRRGRGFDARDHATATPVGLLNEAAVRRWFPDRDPIGTRVLSGGPREIVGVVGDVLQRNPGQAAIPQLLVPHAQRTTRSVQVIVRGEGDPLARAGAIREQVRALDPNLPVAEFTPLDAMVARSVARPRFYTSVFTLFAAVALALAATGIFGVMSYTVAQRAREISIRMALGARTVDVLRAIVGRAMALAGLGVVFGIAAALALGRVIENQLFGVGLFDPLTLAAVTLVLFASAGMASFLPARRAAGVDPARAFRQS